MCSNDCIGGVQKNIGKEARLNDFVNIKNAENPDGEEDRIDRGYSVKLDGIFEGPMDLLVHLIKKNEVDIYDIPIALITDQYLGYIEWMKAMNIDFAGQFLVMAASLTQIKSKMLLPIHDGELNEDDDPRSEITRPLLEYLQMKSAAEQLSQRHLLGQDIFTRKSDTDEFLNLEDEEVVKIGLFELIDAFQRILSNAGQGSSLEVDADTISVKDKINALVEILEKKGSVAFDELFPAQAEKADIIVTFLAILEMVKLRLIRIFQHVQTGIIRLIYQ